MVLLERILEWYRIRHVINKNVEPFSYVNAILIEIPVGYDSLHWSDN